MDRDETVCFCFGFTKGQISSDALSGSRPSIAERIAQAKRQGRCRCSQTHPSGR